jgi:hypothetical protein
MDMYKNQTLSWRPYLARYGHSQAYIRFCSTDADCVAKLTDPPRHPIEARHEGKAPLRCMRPYLGLAAVRSTEAAFPKEEAKSAFIVR